MQIDKVENFETSFIWRKDETHTHHNEFSASDTFIVRFDGAHLFTQAIQTFN